MRVVDLGGKLVVLGFNDAHVHCYADGSHQASVQLRDAKSDLVSTLKLSISELNTKPAYVCVRAVYPRGFKDNNLSLRSVLIPSSTLVYPDANQT